MQLLTIGLTNPIKGFENRLKLEFELLKEEGINIVLKKVNKGSAVYCNCYVVNNNLNGERYNYMIKTFLHCVANALSDIIINCFEPRLIKKIIKSDYFYFNKDEQNLIYDYAVDVLNFNDLKGKYDLLYQIKRKTFILHKILHYVSENSIIILDGFVNFRLREYIGQLESAVDEAVEEYVTNREYQEFILLLRYFIDLQESKQDLVHVVLKNDQFYLFDKNIKPIKNDEFLDLVAKENPEITADDVIIIALINMAPKKITIHGFTGIEKIEVIGALYNIFEDKIVFCNYCDICRDIISLKKK